MQQVTKESGLDGSFVRSSGMRRPYVALLETDVSRETPSPSATEFQRSSGLKPAQAPRRGAVLHVEHDSRVSSQ
jgi:hypothetical protein